MEGYREWTRIGTEQRMDMNEISRKDAKGTANGHEWTRIGTEQRMDMNEISRKDAKGTANGHEWTRIWSERRPSYRFTRMDSSF